MARRRLETVVVELPPKPKTLRQKFEAWVAEWYPGFKTRFITGLGALGSFAAFVQQYISGLPLDQFITAKNLAITTAILFTIAYWFRSISNRYGPQPPSPE